MEAKTVFLRTKNKRGRNDYLLTETESRVYLNVLRSLRKNGKFAELVLFAWSQVERSVEWLVLWDLGLERVDDVRTRILNDLPFWKKLSLLRVRGVVRKNDMHKIQAFQKTRNYLFHQGGKSVLELDLGDKRGMMMSDAVSTVMATYAAELRCLRKRSRSGVRG